MPPREDLIGRHFHQLTVIADAGSNAIYGRRRVQWRCRCDCGKETVVLADHLRSGNTKSCGCRRDEVAAARLTVHGKAYSPEYRVWTGMLRRCLHPSTWAYRHYGGRGIQVCDRWLKFPAFYADMGPRPTPRHTLERRNNDGNYAPENCYWATPIEQHNNTRHNRFLSWNGESHTIADWSRITGISRTILTNRLYRHWPLERLLTQPPRPR